MADRTTIGVSSETRDLVADYRRRLRLYQGRSASNDQLLGALLEGVPLWQADLMVGAYVAYKAQSGAPELDEDDPGG